MRILVASAHRYPDLARLWYRGVAKDVAPAFRAAGCDVEVVVYRDADPESFPPAWFPGATLEGAREGARDFLEFYDTLPARDAELVLLLDADVFVLDGAWLAAHAARFADPRLAAVSFVRRTDMPGVYALLFRAASYRELAPPVFAPSFEDLARWPRATNRQPGDRAALALRAAGRTILDVPAAEAAPRLADFHGTTVIRASREAMGPLLGDRFDALLSDKPYFAIGAYDNLLLGSLYEALFGEPFAAAGGAALAASATEEALRRALANARPDVLATVAAYVRRSDASFRRLAAHEGVTLRPPRVLGVAQLVAARAHELARHVLRGRA